MKYQKLEVSCSEAPTRLNRTFYVLEEMTLLELACAIQLSFRTEFEHLFSFHDKKVHYDLETMADERIDEASLMRETTLSQMGKQFVFEYDFGDGWEFLCVKHGKPEERDETERVIYVSGKGAGIFEDEISTFYDYIDGRINPEMSEDYEDGEHFWVMPWNLSLEKMGDFDLPLDPEEEQEVISSELEEVYGNLLQRDYESGEADEFIPVGMGPSESSVWYRYSQLYDEAEFGFMDEPDGTAWIALFDEFKRVCAVLKEEGNLPEVFSELTEQYRPVSEYDWMPDFSCMTDVMPDELEMSGHYEECLSIMQEFKEMFDF